MKIYTVKKKIIFFLMFVAMLVNNNVMASSLNDAFINVSDKTVEVSGNSGVGESNIVLTVLNPSGNLESLGENSHYLQYQRIIKTEENGEFSHLFKLNLDGVDDSGTYRIYINGEGIEEPLFKDFYYATDQEVAAVISGIVNADSADSIKSILDHEANAKKLSVISFKPFFAQDKGETARLLYNAVKDYNGEIDASKMQEMIYRCSVIAAFNNGASDLVISETGEFIYDDILGFSGLDEEFDMSLINAYNTLISAQGKKLIRNALMNKDYDNLSEFKIDFAKEIMLKGLTNSQKSGFAHVKKIITNKNANVVGLELNITLSDKNAIEIAGEKEYTSIEILQNRINSLKNNSSPSFNKDSSVSVGGGIGSITVDRTHYPSAKEEKEEDNSVIEPVLEFSDLEGYEWAQEAIISLKEKGIINGVSDTEFAPDKEVTREQTVKILCVAKGLEISEEESGFTDVDNTMWYAGYINSAKKAMIVSGISEIEFGVGKNITRQDLAVMIARAFDLELSEEETELTDFDEISDYAKGAVSTLNKMNVIRGYNDGSFKPSEFCTRAEAAVIIYRILGGNA